MGTGIRELRPLKNLSKHRSERRLNYYFFFWWVMWQFQGTFSKWSIHTLLKVHYASKGLLFFAVLFLLWRLAQENKIYGYNRQGNVVGRKRPGRAPSALPLRQGARCEGRTLCGAAQGSIGTDACFCRRSSECKSQRTEGHVPDVSLSKVASHRLKTGFRLEAVPRVSGAYPKAP